MTPQDPWERLPGETPAEYAWFSHWLKLGPAWRADSQSALNETARLFRVESTVFKETIARNRWDARAAAFDEGWVDRDVSKQLAMRVKAERASLVLDGLALSSEWVRRLRVKSIDDPASVPKLPEVSDFLRTVDTIANRAIGGADVVVDIVRGRSVTELSDEELAKVIDAAATRKK